jgi:imidazolonepropionase
MRSRLLVRGARQLLTLRAPSEPAGASSQHRLGLLTDGSILIENGKILHVGPARRIDNLALSRDVPVIEAHGKVVMPALIDAFACVPDSLAANRRLSRFAASHGTAWISLAGGVAPLRAFLASEPSPCVQPNVDTALGEDLTPGKLLRLAPCTAAYVDLALPSPVSPRHLRSAGIPIRCRCSGDGPEDWLAIALAIGARSVDASAFSEFDLRLLAECGMPAILTPQTAGLARPLLDAGCVAALGSGFGAPGGITCSMFTAIGAVHREARVSLPEALAMATIDAARALGIAESHGSLEAGKSADLLILNLSDYRDLSLYFGVHIVDKILRAGNVMA